MALERHRLGELTESKFDYFIHESEWIRNAIERLMVQRYDEWIKKTISYIQRQILLRCLANSPTIKDKTPEPTSMRFRTYFSTLHISRLFLCFLYLQGSLFKHLKTDPGKVETTFRMACVRTSNFDLAVV